MIYIQIFGKEVRYRRLGLATYGMNMYRNISLIEDVDVFDAHSRDVFQRFFTYGNLHN